MRDQKPKKVKLKYRCPIFRIGKGQTWNEKTKKGKRKRKHEGGGGEGIRGPERGYYHCKVWRRAPPRGQRSPPPRPRSRATLGSQTSKTKSEKKKEKLKKKEEKKKTSEILSKYRKGKGK